jgi:hypothetical protein
MAKSDCPPTPWRLGVNAYFNLMDLMIDGAEADCRVARPVAVVLRGANQVFRDWGYSLDTPQPTRCPRISFPG